jgi:5-methyltetrahydrofolate--homocysteine methyltransferase
MTNLLEKVLAEDGVLLLDGAMGTMLMQAGLGEGVAPEAWNLERPQEVRAVHRAYIAAGAGLILTNTFGGTRPRLAHNNLDGQTVEINWAAAALAKAEAKKAEGPVVVAGSMGPTGELLEPLGTLSADQARAAFAEQAGALAQGGVDLLWIETMSALEEVRAAIEGARSVTDLPVAASMTFDTHGRTMMGVSPEQAIQALSGYGLAALGANCGNGPEEIEAVVRAMHALAPDALLIAKSNAGLPQPEGDVIRYDGTPEVMAAYAQRARAAGARLIGGCCGSTPAHIKAMAQALAPDQSPD